MKIEESIKRERSNSSNILSIFSSDSEAHFFGKYCKEGLLEKSESSDILSVFF